MGPKCGSEDGCIDSRVDTRLTGINQCLVLDAVSSVSGAVS